MTIFICGDSTAASYPPDRAPLTGWGQAMADMLPDIPVVNAAMAGRSTKSFLSEGRLIPVEERLQPGDLMLIQFTHNDWSDLVWRHTDPYTSFVNNLSIFVETARLAEAVPVLLTPICLRAFEGGVLQPAHGAYPEAIRTLARSRGVPLIDLYAMSFRAISDMGDEASRRLYMNVAPGEYPAYPDGQQDDVHTRYEGAALYARMVADALRALKLI